MLTESIKFRALSRRAALVHLETVHRDGTWPAEYLHAVRRMLMDIADDEFAGTLEIAAEVSDGHLHVNVTLDDVKTVG